MDMAFLSLLEQKELPYITVKEICTTAGVNRSTFYLHYETINDLLEESVRHMNRQFLDYMAHDTKTFISNLKDCTLDELYLLTPHYLTPYLNYIKEHRRLFHTAMKNAGTLGLPDSYQRMYRHVIAPILNRYHVPEKERAYRMAFYIRGLMAIITEWLEQGCTDDIEQIIAIIQACIAPAQAYDASALQHKTPTC